MGSALTSRRHVEEPFPTVPQLACLVEYAVMAALREPATLQFRRGRVHGRRAVLFCCVSLTGVIVVSPVAAVREFGMLPEHFVPPDVVLITTHLQGEPTGPESDATCNVRELLRIACFLQDSGCFRADTDTGADADGNDETPLPPLNTPAVAQYPTRPAAVSSVCGGALPLR